MLNQPLSFENQKKKKADNVVYENIDRDEIQSSILKMFALFKNTAIPGMSYVKVLKSLSSKKTLLLGAMKEIL